MSTNQLNATCPCCKTPIQPEEAVIFCNVCGTPHHLSCWQKNQGCASPACPTVRQRAVPSQNAAPVPVAPKPAPAAPVAPVQKQPAKPMEILYESKDTVFMENVPFAREYALLIADHPNDKMVARFTFKCLNDKPIKAVLVSVACQDIWGNALGQPILFQYIDLNTRREQRFGQNIAIDLPDKATRKIHLSVEKILFADDTLVEGGDEICVLPAPVLLNQQLPSNALVAQYMRETTPKAQFVPESTNGYWRCTCGVLNISGEETCHHCGCGREQVMAALNADALQAHLTSFLAAQKAAAEKAEAERAEQIRQAEEKARLEQERILREKQELQAKKRKKRKKIVIISSILLVIALTCGTIFFGIPYYHYRTACDALENGQYDAAYQGFAELDGFLNSADMANKAQYLKAEALLKKRQFDAAHDIFVSLGSYENSAERAKFCLYQKAQNLLDDKAFDEANDIFASLGDYSNSATMANEALYQKAESWLQEKKFDEASALFASLGDYSDSADMAMECLYQKAESLLENKLFDDANKLFASLGNYSNSADMAKECLYQKGMDYLQWKQYDAAIKLFTEISGYSDSATMAKEAKYQKACNLLSKKDYKAAVRLFDELGNYSLSEMKCNEAMYAYVCANRNNRDQTTYTYLRSLKSDGYRDSSSIYKELYSWKITVEAWNSDLDSYVNKSSISKYDPVYCHFKLTGGTPNEETVIHIKGTRPNGSAIDYVFTYATGDGFVGWFGFTDGLYKDPKYGATGTLYLTFYDRNGNKIGTASIKITD